MKVLKGPDRVAAIQDAVNEYVAWVLHNKPKRLNAKNMDIAIRVPLIDALMNAMVLAEYDGRVINLSYLPT